jgi:hypothetical protein
MHLLCTHFGSFIPSNIYQKIDNQYVKYAKLPKAENFQKLLPFENNVHSWQSGNPVNLGSDDYPDRVTMGVCANNCKQHKTLIISQKIARIF